MSQLPKILVVDDDEINRNIIKNKLSTLEYELFLAENGRIALDIIKENPPDLVLLDIVMPEVTGYEVAKILKSDPKTRFIPVVMITALDDVEDRIKALEAGADDFLTKPIDSTELTVRVRTLLRLKEYHDHMQEYQGELEVVNQQLKDAIIATNKKKEEALEMSNLLLEEKKKVSQYANEMEALAEERANQLIHADRMASLGVMSAGIAHEINNPATFINVSASTLGKWRPDLEQLVQYALEEGIDQKLGLKRLKKFNHLFPETIDSIKHGVKRISLITNSLKSFARDEPGTKEPVRIEDPIQAALTISRSQYKHISEITLAIDDNIPEIQGNAQQLEQVLINLIVNATDSIQEKAEKGLSDQDNFFGKIVISVKHLQGEKDVIEIQLTDDGMGMSDAVLEKIFMPFFTTKPQDKGTGLGMSIVYGIVNDHGGEITCDSTINKGSAFRIVLPV